MSTSKAKRQELHNLRDGYRTAFRDWASARMALDDLAGPEVTSSKYNGQEHEVAAALAYRSARDHLTEAMSQSHGKGTTTMSNPTRETLLSKTISREWRRDYALAILMIVLAVAGGVLIAFLIR